MARVRHSRSRAAYFLAAFAAVIVLSCAAYLYLANAFADASLAPIGISTSVPFPALEPLVALADSSVPEMLRPSAFTLSVALLVATTLSTLILLALLYREREREDEFLAMKSDFVAASAHELRSPLTSIRWTLSSLQRDPTLSPAAHATVNQLYERVRSLIDLTNTFLIATSTEHGVMRPDDLRVVDIAPTLMKAIEHSAMLAHMKSITINPVIAADQKIIVRADAERLRLVFENLISNSIKYSPQGSTVTIGFVDEGPTRLFTFKDQGIGVPKQFQKAIFTGFQRAANAKKSGIHGSGFGLYMVKKIVDFHGGTVWCESETGKGSTFSVRIPSGV